jgi:uncharacterized membrane protein YfcA
MNLEPWQWALAVVAALSIGLAKTGISGLGMLAVVIFANLLPAREASGFVLPMLVFADVVAVASYRRHAQWNYLWKLFPWTAVGVIAGFMALGRIDDRQAKVMIGIIVLALLAVHLVRRTRPAAEERAEHGWWYAPVVGVLAGFTTLVANAAGPLMIIYLLSMRLPKLEFMGTAAYYFLLINLFKVPFMLNLGLIDARSFTSNLLLLPAVMVGALAGRVLLKHINQKLFENLALGLSAVAGVKLLF